MLEPMCGRDSSITGVLCMWLVDGGCLGVFLVCFPHVTPVCIRTYYYSIASTSTFGTDVWLVWLFFWWVQSGWME